MSEIRRGGYAALLLAVLIPAAARGDDFSVERLRLGEQALRGGRIPEAVDQLRIACFGLLEQVSALSACLVHLAVAEDAARRSDDTQATLLRFLEVERRFAPYRTAPVPPDVRGRFEALLAARIPAETLREYPALSGRVETEDERLARLPEKERHKTLEALADRATRALEADEENVEARILRVRSRTALGEYRGALEDLAKLPDEEWRTRPDLYADLFVSEVGTGDWDAAARSLPKVPSALLGRPEVQSARSALTAEQARRKAP
jgi:hypothetical protein